MTQNEIALHRATIDWLLEDADSYTHAVTLTLKPYCTTLTERGTFREVLTPIEAKRNFSFFLKRLNCELFGNAAKRFGRSVTVLPILEGDGSATLYHYHCALGNMPSNLSEKAITAKIASAWHQTRFGNEQIDVQPMRNTGWIRYIAKYIEVRNTDAVDLDNYSRPSASLT